jgi:hypothetical protein
MRETHYRFVLLLLAVSVFAATAWTTGCDDKGTDLGETTNGGEETGDEGATDDDTPDDPGDGADGDDTTAADHGVDAGVGEVEFEEPGEQAGDISEDELIQRYPAGKKWRGASTIQVTGRASNLDLNLEKAVAFGYDSNVVADVTVVSNDGNRVVFNIKFHAIISELVVDDVEVQLVPPTPEQRALLKFADLAAKALLVHDPLLLGQYIAITEGLKTAGKGIDMVDPGLKKTLTYLLKNRFDVPGGVEKYKARVEKLSLKRFRVEYLRDFGIKRITQLDETRVFTRPQIERVVNYVSVFLDYYVFPMETKVGDQYDVDASDIAGILILDPDADVTGQISLRRDKDRSPGTGMITVTEGTLTYETSSRQDEENVNVSTPGGYFLVDLKHHLVTYARINLSASRIVATKDHLLFSAEDAVNIEAHAYYEAEMLTEDGDK